ncbi:MAG: sulfatase family protein [Planctomycetota bacterium]|jgi:arylsulfatase A-like enzyme
MAAPNLVLIVCHDLGDYLGCYGTPVRTPNIDSTARQGALLENHFSTGSVCSPSRGSMMTGCYPHTHGLMGLVHRGWELDVAKCPPLPLLLQQAGYGTHLFGVQHEHWEPARLGYGEIHEARSHSADAVTPPFTDWLRSRKGEGRPFLCSIGFSETHRIGLNPSHFRRDAYQPPDPAEVEVRPYLPDIPEVRRDLADFYGAVNLVDRMVGQILDALDEVGIADETLLIFTTDHGASFMHSKATLYDGGTKVACLIRWRGTISAGRRCAALTSHVDLLPTILELLDLPAPAHVQGRSFAPALRGEPSEGRRYVFAEKNYTNYYDPARMVRSNRFKYIRKGLRTCIFDFIIAEIELCPSGFRRNRAVFEFYSAARRQEEFYDLVADPGELNNLVDEPGSQEGLRELRAALEGHLERTDDPFRHLRNDILMPEHAYERVRARRR